MSEPLWPEAPTLRAVAAFVATGLDTQRQTLALDPAPDWIGVVTLALEHNVAGLVRRAIRRVGPAGMPAPLVQAITRHAAMIANRNEAALGELHRLRAALAGSGIDSIPLKGVWLCQRVYGDLEARPSRDIDFLIADTAIPEALRVLDACGYPTHTGLTPRQLRAKSRYAGQLVFHHRDGTFVVEPHWALAPHTLGIALDHIGLWQRSRTLQIGTVSLPTLAPEDEFILLCLHGFKEEWARLKWLADLAGFVIAHPDLDFAEAAARARRQGMWWIVLVGVLMIAEVFGVETPLTTEARLAAQPVATTKRLLDRMADASHGKQKIAPDSNIYQISRIRLAMRENRRDRFRYVLRSILTPREAHFRTWKLPDALHPAYVPLKLAQDYVLIPCWVLAKRLMPPRRSRVSGAAK